MRVVDTWAHRSWRAERLRGRAGALHAREIPEPATRTVSIIEVEQPAVVLGVAQRDEVIDHRAAADAGVDVVRRRGGGGAVWLAAGRQLWIDVVIGRDDPLWDDDVGRAFVWFGRVWARSLGSLGFAAEVHRGPLITTQWSDRICFDGLGPGEVTVDGQKIVGISQRRVRAGARFQSVCYGADGTAALLDLLALDPASRRSVADGLNVLGVADLAGVEAAVLAHLPE